jgi:hypothetical protein
MPDYGQFLKDMTAATPGLKEWDGTLKITIKPFTASPGTVYFCLGSIMAATGNARMLITRPPNGETRALNFTTAGYSNGVKFSLPTGGMTAYFSGLFGLVSDKYKSAFITLPSGSINTAYPNTGSGWVNSACVDVDDTVGGFFRGLSAAELDSLFYSLHVSRYVAIANAIALQNGKLLIFPRNKLATDSNIRISIMSYDLSTGAFTPSFSWYTYSPATYFTNQALLDMASCVWRNNANTRIFFNTGDAKAISQSSTFCINIGSSGDPYGSASYINTISACGAISYSDDTCLLFPKEARGSTQATNKIVRFNNNTGASTTAFTTSILRAYSGVKQLGDGIGIALPSGRYNSGSTPSVATVNGNTFKDTPIPELTNIGDIYSQGCCYLGNKIYQLFGQRFITYELVGVGAPPIEYQMHPYINHT